MVLSIGRESFVWAVGSLCDLHRVPYDAELLLGRFRSPYDTASLQQAALACDFKVAHHVNDIHPTFFRYWQYLSQKNFKSHKQSTPKKLSPKRCLNTNSIKIRGSNRLASIAFCRNSSNTKKFMRWIIK